VRIAIAADHAGFPLKAELVPWLTDTGHEVLDLGTDSTESVDYPPLCAAAGRAVVGGEASFGIVLGGSGQGEQIGRHGCSRRRGPPRSSPPPRGAGRFQTLPVPVGV
jgi:RpiB/LacA/LacB family sugar-phosphate isomerase